MGTVLRASILLAALVLIPGVASAQPGGCGSPDRPLLGFSIGRSSPYFDVHPETINPAGASVMVGSGFQVGGRGEFSIGGPFRIRAEGSRAWWEVERRTYNPDTSTPEGHAGVWQVGAQIGLRGGRAPVCWYVLAGGGLYSISYRDDTSHQPGVAITPGMDFPTGDRGRLQLEAQLHIINAESRPPVQSSAVLALSLVVGWVYRF
jgi:hypothetical protein